MVCVMVGGAALGAPALAAPAGEASAVETDGAAAGIGDIVVTARRRAESIQQVPVAVSAVSGEMIERSHLADTTQLAQFAPNVVLNNIEAGTPGGGAFSIRGISYQDVEKTFDPTVLVMVDGVVRGSGTGQTMSLLDIERVEVLRGPQGTLFGKNAVGGIINITRKAPQTGRTFGSVRATAGNYGTNNFEGYLNIGTDQFAVKLTGARLDHDGYFRNRTLATHEGARTEEDYGVSLLWQPSDSFSAKLGYDRKNINGSPAPTLNISDSAAPGAAGDSLCSDFGQCAAAPGKTQDGNPFVTLGNRPGELHYDEDFVVGEVNWDFVKDLRLTYLFGYLKSNDYLAFDSDGSPISFFSINRNGTYEQKSHEVRLSYSGKVVNWQGGLYFWDSKSQDTQFYETFGNFADAFAGRSKSVSVYGEGDVRLGKFVATGGLRYIEEKKSIFKANLNAGGSRKDDDVIWRVGLRYEANRDLMAYLTASTGFRSGGFSARATSLSVLQAGQGPEQLENYEAGIKSTWFDGRLRLNLAAFHMIYKDMQIESNIPCASCGSGGQETAVLNVGKATIDGIELEMRAQITPNWGLTGNLGLLDARYNSFFTDLLGTGTPADFSDLPLRRAPDVTWAVQSTYDIPLPSGNLSARVAYNRTSDYAGTINDHPGTHVGSFGLLNASLTYDHGDHLSFSVFGNNLTNEGAFSHTYAVAPTPQGGSLWKFANPRTPRTFGASVVFRFGDQ